MKKKIGFVVKTLLLFGLLATATLFSLGYFVDASEKPRRCDLIVSLGGGDGRRIQEALRLWQAGYSKSGKLLYSGREIVNPALKPPQRFDKKRFLRNGGMHADQILYLPREVSFNTAEELFFVRDLMLRCGLKSVLIVSSPIHTRRIKILGERVAGFRDTGLQLHVTAFRDEHWRPWHYLWEKRWREGVFLEVEKLVYNLLKYSPLTIDETAYAKKRRMPLWQTKLDQLCVLQKSAPPVHAGRIDATR